MRGADPDYSVRQRSMSQRSVRRRSAVLLIACWAASASHLSAQSCTSLPHEPGELWLAAGVLNTGGTVWQEIGFEASPGDRFGISFRRVTGGSEEDVDLQSFAARVGVPFSAPVARFCIFGGFELNDFSFLDRFELDRGKADFLAREIGLRADVPVADLSGAELRAWIAPALTYLRWEASGRTLIIDDDVSAEERHLGGTEWTFSGKAGLTLRWGRFGVSGGVTRRPAISSGTLGFVRFGVAAIRGG